MHQITTSENHLLIGGADAAPGYERIASVITEGFAGEGGTAFVPVVDEHNGDWDVLYPFSQVCDFVLYPFWHVKWLTFCVIVVPGALQDRPAYRASV